jgi:hypothetical protein
MPYPRSALATCAVALGLVSLLPGSVPASAGGDDSPPPAIAPRLAALEHEIRFVERHLTVLRHARTDLAAGRAEAVASDEAGQRVADLDQRALRELQRYEAARAKANDQLTDALSARDDARAALARGTLDGLDSGFAESMRKIEESRESKERDPKEPSRPRKTPAKGDGKADSSKPGDDGAKGDKPAMGERGEAGMGD